MNNFKMLHVVEDLCGPLKNFCVDPERPTEISHVRDTVQRTIGQVSDPRGLHSLGLLEQETSFLYALADIIFDALADIIFA